MRLSAIVPAATIAFLASSAAAQLGNPGTATPGTGQAAPGIPAPHQTNVTDRLFARLAATGGKAEVGLAQLAEQKAVSSAVKDFARMMGEDHSKANDKLAALAQAAGIPLPGDLDPDHKAVREKLEKVSGADFDAAYILAQIEDHQKTVQLLEWEIGSGEDAPLQQFAAETLPIVLGHLRRAQEVASQLTGQTPLEIAPRVSSTSEGRASGARRQ
jgi:putative membrane protein